MPDSIYRPNADGSVLQWIPSGGGVHYDEVFEVVADDDATFIYFGPYIPNGLPTDQWHIQDPGVELPLTAVINYIEVFHRGRAVNGISRIWVSPLIYNLDWVWPGPYWGPTVRYQGRSYLDFTQRWYINPDSGSNFQRSDLLNLQIGVVKMGSGGTVRCTQAYLTVNWSEFNNVGGRADDWE